MENCIFCKIIKNEIPSEKVFENKGFLAFLDIQPVNHGHLLVIPKKHVVWMHEADDATISRIFKLSKKLMRSLIKGLKCDYVTVSVVGKDVPHFHVHLIPRHLNDGHALKGWPTKKYQGEEMKKVVQKIIQAL